MLTDIAISQANKPLPVTEIAAGLGVAAEELELYGPWKAKLTLPKMQELIASPKKGKLVLVTAITPTPAGEGKSTVSIGLADALRLIGKKAVLALREPSLGPCFGVKGGAAGGGYSQVVPMEDINLHFTGDIHAISAANNLLSSIIDNHIQQGNLLGLDPRRISWKRCVDLNDRALRKVVVGLGGSNDGVPREDGFNISVASEIMAVICLSRSIAELKNRLGNIVIGQTYDKRYVRAAELNVAGALTAVLKDALRPNLVQTLEKTPAFIHGGPFANIAHGCNSIAATLCALSLGDYVITEAGFGADLGAEKFIDIKCRTAGIEPSAVVIVATVRALKMHGGIAKDCLCVPDADAVKRGFVNLKTHIENIARFGVPAVVAINHFTGDTEEEIASVRELAEQFGVKAIVTKGWAEGGRGVCSLAEEVARLCDMPHSFRYLYEDKLGLKEKIEKVAFNIYRAESADFHDEALRKLASWTENGYGSLPVCIAKTQNSISHEKKWIGAPSGYRFPVRDVRLFAGAGFVIALAGDILTMPGLPRKPAAENIDVDENGIISGLF